MAYTLEGRLLEVCTCNTLCPCWVGEDPDSGTCDGMLAWHFDRGNIDGVDVSGLTFALLAHIPGNILKGNWRAIAYVDEKASKAQEEGILAVYTGKKGGPVADLAQLVGEVVAVERVPFTFDVEQGKGQVRIGKTVAADLEPFKGAGGKPTALTDTIFSTIPGSPAYVGKASMYKANAPALGLNINLQGHNAVQGSFRFTS
ncbi:MAG: hypothetical protein A2038_14160 [Deltaproteobacteria bacterium GWA2_57_13]|jgi:hypothetical protein|nr:MAG: hypothetical protein A2038_14160 [Deltaproteobacteria bacterium GWA2_57_13]OGQ73719.1 MAG: hypothetical protein A3G40_06550 [Deltaproteobacteria bacterium RIFCSPLOWO2_12_FULL_57_22]